MNGCERMKNFDLLVIGGCSAGLAAAVNAKRFQKGLNVAVLERLPRIGKKILATGNGRCNLTNANALNHPYHNSEFASYALKKYPPESVISFFESMGMLTRADNEGRVYPRSNVASSVLDALRFEIEKLGISVFCDTAVSEIKKTKDGFVVNNEFSARKIIIACGGKASPAQGSDGSAFNAVKSLGHSFTPLYPSLVPLVSSSVETKPLKGIRASGVKLVAEINGRTIAESSGEILFTDSGLSGIAAMELAAEINENVKSKTFTHIDFMPEMSIDELAVYIKNHREIRGNLAIDELLTGILPKMIGIQVCKANKLYSSEKKISSLSYSDCMNLAKKIKDYSLRITGTKDFKDSQVTRGGIKVNEINPETMESRICRGLYFAGEIIDVDGGCGGFNLQWAWSSGLLAGELKQGANYA